MPLCNTTLPLEASPPWRQTHLGGNPPCCCCPLWGYCFVAAIAIDCGVSSLAGMSENDDCESMDWAAPLVSNHVMLTGPVGCGKTAAAYAVAQVCRLSPDYAMCTEVCSALPVVQVPESGDLQSKNTECSVGSIGSAVA